VVGLALMGTLDHTTPYWHVAIFMSVMGVGVGALVQNIVLAVQNTVDVSQVGATSATVSFFRSLGGAVGVAVLGAILANHVTSHVADGLAAAGVQSGGSAGGNLDLKDLPGPIQLIVRSAYGDSFGTLFLIAAAVSVVTLVAVLLVKEVPLRDTVELAPQPVAAADGVSEAVAEGPQASRVNGSADTDSRLEPITIPTQPSNRWDDPTERLSVAALDVLTAAQDQARQHVATSSLSHREVIEVLTSLGSQIDQVVADFHARLDAIQQHLAVPDPGASLAQDGAGADSLRTYEYGLLVNSQRTADKVTRLAKLEAERILTEADEQVVELEGRIRTLRAVEAELSARVTETVRTS
ncbi:MAG TPA: hypothetical protein VIT20_11240, partial [Propionibacteriaceae bacterium]